MVKKGAKQKIRKEQRHEIEQKVDTFARVLQVVALIVALIVIIVDALIKDYEVPIWVIAAILGVALGLSPDQVAKIISDAVKAFVTGKRK